MALLRGHIAFVFYSGEEPVSCCSPCAPSTCQALGVRITMAKKFGMSLGKRALNPAVAAGATRENEIREMAWASYRSQNSRSKPQCSPKTMMRKLTLKRSRQSSAARTSGLVCDVLGRCAYVLPMNSLLLSSAGKSTRLCEVRPGVQQHRMRSGQVQCLVAGDSRQINPPPD